MEHYPKNTVRVTKFCKTCNRRTLHRVDDKRVGICIEQHVKGMSKAQEKRQNKIAADTGSLFEEGENASL
jgi:hypothetical protein